MPRLLSIDDDRSVHHLVSKTLEDSGVEVLPALSAEAGVEAVKAQAPDVVLLDIMLPDISGYQIVEALRADPGLRDVRVLLMTARGSVVERRKGLALGADGFIAKPFELSELRAEIARLLDRTG